MVCCVFISLSFAVVIVPGLCFLLVGMLLEDSDMDQCSFKRGTFSPLCFIPPSSTSSPNCFVALVT